MKKRLFAKVNGLRKIGQYYPKRGVSGGKANRRNTEFRKTNIRRENRI